MLQTPFLRRISMVAGTLLAVTSMALTLEFGLQIGVGAALALVTISFMASYIAPILWEVYKTSRVTAYVGAVIAALIITADITTNSSTLGVYRTTDVVAGDVQQTKYEDNRKIVADLEGKKAFLEKRLSDLQGSAGWTGTKPAAAFVGEIEAAQLAIEQEKRRGGCGPRCLALTRNLAELEANKATAEAHERDAAMLASTIAALERARAQSATTDVGGSAVGTQNLKLASIVTLTRAPTEGAKFWTDTLLMVLFGALITIASVFFNLVSWSQSDLIDRLMGSSPAAPTLPAAHQTPVSAPQTSIVQITDETLRRWAQSPEVRKLHAA